MSSMSNKKSRVVSTCQAVAVANRVPWWWEKYTSRIYPYHTRAQHEKRGDDGLRITF